MFARNHAEACTLCGLCVKFAVSRKAHELLHEEESRTAGVQLIKRFSGGGTVVVDEDTVFATLIMQQSAIPEVECYPRSIMRWSQEFYDPVFLPHGDFSLQEHGESACCATLNLLSVM